MSHPSFRITFIGAGRMASAMIRSLLRSGHYRADQLACCSANDGTAEALVAETGIAQIDLETNQRFTTDTLVLACKPQQLSTLAQSVLEASSGTLLISILAGTPLLKLKGKMPSCRNWVRVMPNTPGSVGAGVSAFAPDGPLKSEDRSTVETLLGSMGVYLEVRETELDAITAVSGSGPAYVFLFVEALYDAAKQQGFSDEVAMLLAKETVLGSSKLLAESGLAPAELRRQVTSPGGTTQAAIDQFQSDGFAALVARAVQAAHDRSLELGQLD